MNEANSLLKVRFLEGDPSCPRELPWNMEFSPLRWSEDGLYRVVNSVRQMFIQEQNDYSGELSYDAFIERMEEEYCGQLFADDDEADLV